MHFQFREVLEADDLDLVVRALETHLRPLAKDVLRSQNELVALGIGPSPIAKNGRDRSVFVVTRGAGGVQLEVDVTYQASALLGTVSQNDVVRDKIMGALLKVQTDLRLGGVPMAKGPVLMNDAEQKVASGMAMGGVMTAASEMEAVREREVVVPPQEPVAVEAVALPVVPPPVIAPQINGAREKVAEVPEVGEVAATQAIERPVAAESNGRSSGAVARASWGEGVSPSDAPIGHLTRNPPLQGFVEKNERRGGGLRWLLVTLVVLIGLGVGVVIGRRSTISEPVQSTVVIPHPEVQTVSNDPHEQDLNVWLQHWVAATQGRDPEAQTKFYADPVTWYFRTPHVDQATLLALKQIAPENNNASTMVEIEDLKVTHQTSDSASVQFRRRFLVESTQGRLNERVVPARLKVNRIDGDWKITEEHNLQ